MAQRLATNSAAKETVSEVHDETRDWLNSQEHSFWWLKNRRRINRKHFHQRLSHKRHRKY